MSVAYCNPALNSSTFHISCTTTNNFNLTVEHDSAPAESFFLSALREEARSERREVRGEAREVRGERREVRGEAREVRGERRKMKSEMRKVKSETEFVSLKPVTGNSLQSAGHHFFEMLALNSGKIAAFHPKATAIKNFQHHFLVISLKQVKRFLQAHRFLTIMLLINLFFVTKSFGQTATINLDYTGATGSNCGGTDNTYASGSGSVNFNGGLPAGATITNINVSANLGKTAFGNANFSFTLNTVLVGNINGVSSSCQLNNFNASTISPYNKTGTNTLAFTSSGYLGIAGVYNVTLTITYTVPCPSITASATSSNVLCNGASTGQIIVSGSGGTGPYQYSIHNGGATYQPNNTFNNLPVGTYQIRVKDANGCESKSVQ